MYSADGSVSRTLIPSKAMQHPGTSWGCSKALPKQLCTARDKNSYSLRLIFWPCRAQIHLRTARGKCWGLFLPCSHLSALSALVLMGNGNSKLLMADGWLVVMGLSGVCLHPLCLPLPKERDDSLRTQHSGSAETATLLLQGKSKLGSVDFNVTVTIILVSLRCH